jgi:hypothetical protein
MATLRLIFHGLLGYVMRQEGGEDVVSVLFPSQPLAQQAFGSASFISPAHFPFLRFAKARLDAGSPRQPQYEISVAGSDPDCIVFLQGERLSIPNLTGGVKPFSAASIPAGAATPSADPVAFATEKRDFRWVARMDDAFPTSGVADSDPLTGNQSNLVEAVFDIGAGSIECHKLCGEQPGSTSVSTFALGSAVTPKVQALSEEILVAIGVDSRLTLQSRPLPNGNAAQQPELVLDADGAGVIECHVFNSELDVILKPPSLAFELQRVGTGDPRDFVQLYELSGNRPPVGSRTFPTLQVAAVVAAAGGGGAGDHLCPGGVFHA